MFTFKFLHLFKSAENLAHYQLAVPTGWLQALTNISTVAQNENTNGQILHIMQSSWMIKCKPFSRYKAWERYVITLISTEWLLVVTVPLALELCELFRVVSD